MRSFDLVIFDNDGVLVDSEPHANHVLTGLLNEYGLPITYDESLELFMGGSLLRVRQITEPRLGRPLPTDFEDRYHTDLFDRFRRRLEPIPGIHAALEQIDLPTCVASSGSHARIRLALEITELAERFDGRVFSREDVAHGKPAPDLFLHAATQLGVDPKRCAVIEDSPLGIEAAAAAGMTSFGFARLLPAERLEGATGTVFTEMAALPGLLRCDA